MITHIVFVKLKEYNQDKLSTLTAALAGMKGQIPQLQAIEVGQDLVRSSRSYDLALYTKFKSMEDLQSYQVHPVHQDVLKQLLPLAESILTVDYES